MRIRTTINQNNKRSSNTLLKTRATTLTGYKFATTFSEKKIHCSQVSTGNKNRLDHEFYTSALTIAKMNLND